MHAMGGGFIWPCSSVRDSWGGEGLCNVLCRDLESRRGVGGVGRAVPLQGRISAPSGDAGNPGPRRGPEGAGCTKSLG